MRGEAGQRPPDRAGPHRPPHPQSQGTSEPIRPGQRGEGTEAGESCRRGEVQRAGRGGSPWDPWPQYPRPPCPSLHHTRCPPETTRLGNAKTAAGSSACRARPGSELPPEPLKGLWEAGPPAPPGTPTATQEPPMSPATDHWPRPAFSRPGAFMTSHLSSRVLLGISFQFPAGPLSQGSRSLPEAPQST